MLSVHCSGSKPLVNSMYVRRRLGVSGPVSWYQLVASVLSWLEWSFESTMQLMVTCVDGNIDEMGDCHQEFTDAHSGGNAKCRGVGRSR